MLKRPQTQAHRALPDANELRLLLPHLISWGRTRSAPLKSNVARRAVDVPLPGATRRVARGKEAAAVPDVLQQQLEAWKRGQ